MSGSEQDVKVVLTIDRKTRRFLREITDTDGSGGKAEESEGLRQILKEIIRELDRAGD